jgi:hypothetical protein
MAEYYRSADQLDRVLRLLRRLGAVAGGIQPSRSTIRARSTERPLHHLRVAGAILAASLLAASPSVAADAEVERGTCLVPLGQLQ